MLLLLLPSMALSICLAYWGSHWAWIALGMSPLIILPMLRFNASVEPDLEQARLQMTQREFDQFELIHTLPDAANEPLQPLDESSVTALRARLIGTQETLSAATLAAGKLQLVIDSVREAATQTQLIAREGVFSAAKVGAEGRAYASVCLEADRIAQRGIVIYQQSAPVLRQLETMGQHLMQSIETQITAIDQATTLDAGTVSDMHHLALEIRSECQRIETKIAKLSEHNTTESQRYKGLTQILLATQSCSGALIELSESFSKSFSRTAG